MNRLRVISYCRVDSPDILTSKHLPPQFWQTANEIDTCPLVRPEALSGLSDITPGLIRRHWADSVGYCYSDLVPIPPPPPASKHCWSAVRHRPVRDLQQPNLLIKRNIWTAKQNIVVIQTIMLTFVIKEYAIDSSFLWKLIKYSLDVCVKWMSIVIRTTGARQFEWTAVIRSAARRVKWDRASLELAKCLHS